MTARRRLEPPDPVLAELAALREVIAEHAALLIEHGHDIAELMAARSRGAPPPELAPLKVACDRTGYDRRSIVRFARAGAIVGRRTGGRWYIDTASLLRFIAARGHAVPK